MQRNFFNISAFFFFYFSIIGVWVIFLPKILQDFGYSSTQIGIIFSISPLMRFLTPFFFLKLFSLTNRVLHISLIVMLLCIPFIYLSVDKFEYFLVVNIIFGVSFGLVLPYMETYSLSILGKERYGKSRLWGSIGFLLVALVLAKLLENNYMGIHFIAVCIIITVIFTYLNSLDDSHFSSNVKKDENSFSFTDNLSLWISIFLMQVGFGAFYSFFTIYAADHGVMIDDVSYLWTFGVLCEIALFYYQSFFMRFKLIYLIEFSIGITAFRWMLLYLYPNNISILYASQMIHAFSFALYHTATLSYLYTLYKNKKLASQFYYGFGFGLGGFFGSLIAGYFYGEYLFLSSAIFVFIAFLILFFSRYNRTKLNS
jgi:PPP family 3-phenylpropionic acid transporter